MMIFQEVKWLRSKSHKMCSVLRKSTLDWYRTYRRIPCYLQRILRFIKQHWTKIPVIVQIEDAEDLDYSISNLTHQAGCKLERKLTLIGGFATRVTAKNLKILLENTSVKKIWYDREVKALLDIASKTVQAHLLWQKEVTGKNIGVAVIDTGIYNHPDLAGRITAFKDFIKSNASPYDDNGHGTHVAGDIAGNGHSSNNLYQGPAPDANIIGVKVLDKMGAGSLSTVIQGIQWCIENKDTYNIRVMNLSLGSEARESYQNDPVCQAVEKAWQSGIVVCAAAGNSGPKANTINSPGIVPMIITVGAVDDNNTEAATDNTIADFSSRGPTVDNISKPDVIAPGVNIISLRSPRSTIDKTNKDTRIDTLYTSLSGTSMATPICAGIVALMLESDNDLSPDEVKTRLISTATRLPGLDENSQGAGLINGNLAIGNILQPDSNYEYI